jgi:putative transposase
MVMPSKVDDTDYIDYLIASPRRFTCTEASRSQPEREDPSDMPAHDSFNRLLERSFDPESLWREAKPLVRLRGGVLVVDDSTLDKPYAKRIELMTQHWSGKHHQVVWGINLITCLWTDDGDKLVPCDFRVYDKPMGLLGPFGGKNKNEHFRDMLVKAKERGFDPNYVVFDSWYTAIKNLKLIRSLGWHWLARMKSNRLVNPSGEKGGNVPISDVEISKKEGRVVHLKAYGSVKLFQFVSKNGDVEYYATDDLEMEEKECEDLSDKGWGIEVYHRGIKQCCGVERSQVRDAIKQLSHISLSLRAFLRLERERIRNGVSWYESKTSIIRGAISSYLASPTLGLTRSA